MRPSHDMFHPGYLSVQYLSLPTWFPVPKSDLVRSSWFEIVGDFVSRCGSVPTVASEQQSSRWHGRRFAGCIASILKHNNVKVHPGQVFHLSGFGLVCVNSIQVQLTVHVPNHTVFLFFSACFHFGGNAFGERKASTKVFSQHACLAVQFRTLSCQTIESVSPWSRHGAVH